MSITKEKILFNNQDIQLKINLSGGNRLTGYQQEIDNFTEEAKVNLINPIIDNEVRRFQYNNASVDATYLNFFYLGSNRFNILFSDGAGFTNKELTSFSDNVLNSFFIMDFYDTFDNNTQTKIFTQYLTQITSGEKTGSGIPVPKYKIYSDTTNQLYYWYVPKSFLEIQTGNTVTGYVKFSFYNAKYGTIALFDNADTASNIAPDRMYFKTRLNLIDMTWKFDYFGTNYPNVRANQVPFTNSYSQKINAGVQNFDDEKQVYPIGNTFQSNTGLYTTNYPSNVKANQVPSTNSYPQNVQNFDDKKQVHPKDNTPQYSDDTHTML